MKTQYRIYGHNKVTGWEQISTKYNEEDAFKIGNRLTGKEYYSYIIIKNAGNGDEVIHRKDFTRECTVEFVDEVKTKIEVKVTTFKPSRMKRKQEERRMFEQYIDR